MADKFRVTFPIPVEFTQGELPSASKLIGVSRQARQGLSKLEYAIGDLWNQSGDFLFNSNPDAALNIPNLARYLGQAALLNPRIPSLPNIEEYTHDFTASTGKYEARLPYPPKPGSSYSWTGSLGIVRSTTPQIKKGDVNATQKWWIDSETGEIFAWDAFAAGQILTYEPIINGDLGEATFNIIPDPDTHSSYSFQGLKLEYVTPGTPDNGFYVYLPPRGPLDTRKVEQSPQDNISSPSHTKNFQNDTATGALKFWQADHVAAATTNAEHYRYVLPKILTEDTSLWTSSVTIPTGFLYLLDPYNTKTIIEGVLFCAEPATSPRKWLFIAKGANLVSWLTSPHGAGIYTEAMLLSNSHDEEYYPTNGLRLITVGSNLSSAFSCLLNSYLNHDHSSSGSLVSRRVNHNLLANLFDVYPVAMPWFDPSNWNLDDHPQYLHRYGANTIDGVRRDRFYNAMLGEFLLSSTVAGSGNNYYNLTGNSNKLSFGKTYDESGPSLFWNATISGLELSLPQYTNVFRIQLKGENNYIEWYCTPSPAPGFRTNHLHSHGALVFETDQASQGFRFTGYNLTVAGYGKPEAEDGKIYSNRQFSGRHNDTTYGYSGSSETQEGYGPVRVHNIYATDWHVNVVDRRATTPDHLSQYRPTGPGPNFLQIEPYQWWDQAVGTPMTTPTNRLVVNLVHRFEAHAMTQLFHHINLPFAQYAIVNARIIFTNTTAFLPKDSLYFSLGSDRFYQGTGGWISSQVVERVSITERFYRLLAVPNTFLLAPLYNQNFNIWDASTTTPLLTAGSVKSHSTNSPWIRLDLDHAVGSGANFLILGVQVFYRIKEF